MIDFAPLQALGPLAPVNEPHSSALIHYLDHYRLTPLLRDNVGLYAGFVDTRHFRLWAQVWSPEQPRGTAFVVHGYFDHLGLYRHLLERLLRQGFRVVLWDLPGHGLSSGPRATIDDFEEYGACLQALQHRLTQDELAPRPWIGLGQSTGASILATDALMQGATAPWQALVLLAPLVRPWGWPQSNWLHRLASPFIDSIPRTYRPNSTDDDFVAFLREGDPLQADRLTLTWVTAMRRWMTHMLTLPASDVPVLILQGEQDLTVDWQWNLEVLQRKFPAARVHCHPEARHHLVNEADIIRESLFDELDGFVDEIEQRCHYSSSTHQPAAL
ncbi:Lysophospholipase, alpha-beta hydrolase superfamily [Modicisalibacter ilicicola DSM 19980]|uniref:Lysophospholipase, alpha-beta hydrolase superfamily n=1 Tax=Modicisalibacter ilicicola DSM 19980 TaxID=1121942 RepID=A0A1M5AEC2_9GAMM|nr:alpha/beta hydrolase [Halomonas ilicicola]SHF28579.1 Lysophospholipase, alpha-beta hydrolase superfamily [Halomonas ilicicola DSM 19980]